MGDEDALSATSRHTAAAASRAAPDDGWPWWFARCWMHLDRFDQHGRDPADIAAAHEDFALVPAEAPGRARLAAAIVDAQLRSGQLQQAEQIDAVAALADIADADPDPRPTWAQQRAAVRALWLMRSLQVGRDGVDARGALAELAELDRVVAGQEPYATVVASALLGARHLVHAQDGDIAANESLISDARKLADAQPPESPQQVRGRILTIMQTAQAALSRGDIATAMARFDEVAAMRDQLPPGDMLGLALDEAMSSMSAIRHMAGGGPAPTPGSASEQLADPLAEMRSRAARTDLSPSQRAMNLTELASAELGLAESDHQLSHLDEAVSHLRDAVELAPEHDPQRAFYLMTYGGALVRRYEIHDANGFTARRGGRDRTDLVDAVAALEQCRSAIGGPAHPYWSTLGQILADAHRFAGRPAQSRDAGRDGLRGHTWSVLLQADTAAATAAARHAATEAVDLARRYLDAHDPAGAAVALDTGRGLVLQAAMRFGSAVEQLTGLRQFDLAERWRAAAGAGDGERAPMDLRREVVGALAAARSPRRSASLDPPDLHEVRAALTRAGADALVYLVPGNGNGVAVVLPVRDEPSVLPLPGLDLRHAGAMDRYVAATAARDARNVGPRDIDAPDVPDGAPDLRSALDDVCAWAWTAATGPLLRHVAGAGDTTRLVLVPMGVLARVPWHAAAEDVAGRRRYAVERAAFSYAVSARLYCDAVWADPIPATASGLVVGDPDGESSDLPGARREALAVHHAFLPAARYLGRTVVGGHRPDGPGTVAEVRAWLADAGPDAGVVIHAACHGSVRPGTDAEATSFLVLADGNLSAEDLVQTLTTRGTRGLALAVLAACNSGVPGRGYDEAFSIGTALLAAGTRSVISSLWTVPDSATSALMFLFHHHRRSLDPVDALRAAQLWMLDPDRTPPPGMPEDLMGLGADPADAVGWAGFTHAGHTTVAR